MNEFLNTLKTIPGLTHYYPLTSDAKDAVGTAHGVSNGVTFLGGHAVFNGSASVQLPDHDDFSVATNGGLTIVAFLTIDDWRGEGALEYVHWMGKGTAGAHEWTFRHYVKGGTGEAPVRQGRTSFYHFNADGGLGAGSYFQDPNLPTNERIIASTCNLYNINLYVDGVRKDSDALSGYSIKPQNTSSRPFLGTRGDNTGFLIGKMRDVAFFNRVLDATEIAKIQAARNQSRQTVDAPVPEDYQATTENLVTKHNALAKALRDRKIV